MVLELGVDQFERITEKLDKLTAEAAAMNTMCSLHEQAMQSVKSHLEKINGRTQKNEERTEVLERLVIELRGAWKLIVAVSSSIGAILTWLVNHLSVK